MQNSSPTPDNQRSLASGDVVDGHRFHPRGGVDELRDFAPLGVRDAQPNRERRAALMSALPDRKDSGFAQTYPHGEGEGEPGIYDDVDPEHAMRILVGATVAILLCLAAWAVL